jgi:hypothetical protein
MDQFGMEYGQGLMNQGWVDRQNALNNHFAQSMGMQSQQQNQLNAQGVQYPPGMTQEQYDENRRQAAKDRLLVLLTED